MLDFFSVPSSVEYNSYFDGKVVLTPPLPSPDFLHAMLLRFEVQQSETGFSLVFGQVRAEVQAKPLLVNIFRDDKLVVALNSRGLLKYEHYRNKPQDQ